MVVCMLDPIVRPPLVCLLWVEGVSGVSPPPYGCWPTAFDCTVHLVGKPVQEETVATQSHWLDPSRVRGLALATGFGCGRVQGAWGLCPMVVLPCVVPTRWGGAVRDTSAAAAC